MDIKTTALLADPAPGSHIVYPYTDENKVVQAIRHYTSSGLSRDEAVVLILSEPHRESLILLLKAEAFNIEMLQSKGQLVILDAAQLLSSLMVGDRPDATVFRAVIKRIIDQAGRDLASGRHRKVRLFGEMVSILWMSGKPKAALRLEELWNEVTDTYPVSLFCTYMLDGNGHSHLPEDLLAAHNHRLAS
jgi:KaiC/GvpD/RAD55 family RecA-like ATPase